MVIDPRMLKSSAPPQHISEPTPCRSCGYDLIGLMNDRACPECGNPIRPRLLSHASEEQMVDAPLAYLRVLALGALLMLVGWLGILVSMVTLGFTPGVAWGAVLTAAGLTWFVGVVVVSRPRPATALTRENREAEWFRLRMSARVSQSLWVLCGGMLVVHMANPGGSPPWLLTAAVAAGAAASIGLIPVSLLVANLADWATDTTLSFKLRLMAVFVPFMPGGVLVGSAEIIPFSLSTIEAGLSEPRGLPIFALLLLVGGLLSIPVLVQTWCWWVLWNDAAWSVSNHLTLEQKEERFRQRSYEQAQQAALEDVGVNPASLPGFHVGANSEVAPPAKPVIAPGNRIRGMAKKKAEDVQPYKLADE